MNRPEASPPNAFLAALRGRCPRCRMGTIFAGPWRLRLRPRCAKCDYDFHPEPGFYLGAMMVPYFFAAMLTVPFGIGMKLSGLEGSTLLIVIAAQYFLVLAPLLWFARPVWLHLEFRITDRLRGRDRSDGPR
jgi:hypothetical protein